MTQYAGRSITPPRGGPTGRASVRAQAIGGEFDKAQRHDGRMAASIEGHFVVFFDRAAHSPALEGLRLVPIKQAMERMISELQAGRRGKERYVIGHPFNPPHLVPLVEVVGGTETDAAAELAEVSGRVAAYAAPGAPAASGSHSGGACSKMIPAVLSISGVTRSQ